MYALVNGELYHHRENGVLLRCISQEEGQELLANIHKGLCSHHVASCAMAEKAMRQGFYWPTVVKDAKYIVKTCEVCQEHSPGRSSPTNNSIVLAFPGLGT